MAVDQTNGRLFIGCANRQMLVLDSANGRVIGAVPIGGRARKRRIREARSFQGHSEFRSLACSREDRS
jgi:hypothetical protein